MITRRRLFGGALSFRRCRSPPPRCAQDRYPAGNMYIAILSSISQLGINSPRCILSGTLR